MFQCGIKNLYKRKVERCGHRHVAVPAPFKSRTQSLPASTFFCRRFYFDARKQTAKLNAVLQGLKFITFAAEIIDDFGKRAHGFPVADPVVQEQDNVIFFSG